MIWCLKMVMAYVIYGLGIGCHKETEHALRMAGAETRFVHANQLLNGDVNIFDSQIIDIPGGFDHGDILGAGMCAANELEHAVINMEKLKDLLLEYAVNRGNVIWGQCNGFQTLVKAGLLPGIDGDYSRQTLTLTNNTCGVYRVTPALHIVETPHFAFQGLPNEFYLWCRHGEGKIQFYSKYGLMSRAEGEENRRKVNENHVLLRYANPETFEPTEQFPHNPNGSIDGIAGLINPTGTIIGHMAHPEVSVYCSRDPRWFSDKDFARTQGIMAEKMEGERMEDIGLKIFRNVVNYFK